MASTLTLKVKVDKADLATLETQIQKINSTPITIKANIPKDIKKFASELSSVAANLAQVTQNLKAANSQQIQATNALANHTNALAKYKKAQNEVKVAEEKTKQEREKTIQATQRAAAQHSKASATIVSSEQRTQQELLKTERQVTRTSNAWKNMFSQFSAANLASSAITRALSSMRQYFHEALTEMKELDTAISHYRQVTGASKEEAGVIGSQAYSVGSKYGTSASDYMESIATYARAGYGDVSDQLAELSLKTVIVGQTTQEIADQFLLTMDAAYGYKGSVQELSKVLDGASAIDNTYATTIEKIAAGLGLVAPLASQVHVSEEELTAAIGTITAVTQRSGAESARALRSLFLNIIGDTTTEIEDGVTATEESVKDLHYVIEKYASSALEAAEASGEVLNPMEAIGALSKSMKEGLLTEAELMDLLSSLGGKLRVSQLVALVSNWDMYTSMIGTYENAMGSADAKVEKYLDSWDAKTNILKNTWTEFVASSLNTDVVKGFLDVVTKLLKNIGSLGNAVKILAAAFATIKLAKATNSILDQLSAVRNLGTQYRNTANAARTSANVYANYGDALRATTQNAKALEYEDKALRAEQEATNLSAKALAFTFATVMVAAISSAILAYNNYRESQKQAALEQARTIQEEAADQLERAKAVEKLYPVYYNAKKALDDGKISAEQYESAVRSLADALGIEASALDTATSSVEAKSRAEAIAALNTTRNTITSLERATSAQMANLGNFFQEYAISGFTGHDDIYKAYRDKYVQTGNESEAIKAATEAYREQLNVIKDYEYYNSHGYSVNPIDTKDYDKAVKYIQDYSDTLGEIISQEDEVERLQELIRGLASGEIAPMSDEQLAEELDKIASSAGGAAAGTEEAEERFYGLAKAINEAKESLVSYNAATKTEKSDNYKAYAEKWQKAYEDIQKGFLGSNAVEAALDLFLTPSQIVELQKKGVDAGKIIGSDFFKSIFTYLDENGVEQFIKGEDAGSTLAWKLYDDFVAGAEKLGEAIDFNIDENGNLSVAVESFEALSAAIKEVYDTDIDPDFLAVWMQSLGMFSSKSQETAANIMEIAQAAQAVNKDGKIDLSKLIQGKIDDGETTVAIWNLYQRILELNEAGEVEIDVTGTNLDEVKEQVETLISTKEDANEDDVEIEATVDDKATPKLESMRNLCTNINGQKVTIPIGVNGYDEALRQLEQVRAAYANLQNTANSSVGATSKKLIGLTVSAKGQRNYSGGLSLINEEAPELIVENGNARIAGSGSPTLTYLQPGADVYTAQETKAILGGDYPSELFDGINAYAGGTASGISRWTPSATSTSSGSTGATYTGGSSSSSSAGGSSSTTEDNTLQTLKDQIALLKSELSLMEARGDSIDDQAAKQRQIQNALLDEIKYLESIGGSQEEINKLYTEWYNIGSDIEKMYEQQRKEQEEAEKERQEAEKERLEAIKEAQEKQLERYENIVDLRKSELDLMEAHGESNRRLIQQNRRISNALQNQINYLVKIGGSTTEINKLKKEQADIDNTIAKLNKGLLDDLETAVNNQIKKINAKRDEELDKVDKKIDALKAEKDVQDELLELQEKELAVEDAKTKLQNARAERTVRYYNARKKQWEWREDANAVKEARDEYNTAKQELADFKKEQKYNAKLESLEAKKDQITEKYLAKTDQWQKILDTLADPVITIAQALKNIENNATKDMASDIKQLNKVLKPLGYAISMKKLYDSGGVLSGLGGIKATAEDEMILPPDITQKMLRPNASAAFAQRMREIGFLYGGASSVSGVTNNTIGSQHNGNIYTYGNIVLTEGQARTTSVYDLARMSQGLRAYNNVV